MKPVFGIDITENRKNTRFNYEAFVVRRLSELSEKQLDTAMDDAAKNEKSMELPQALRILKYVCGGGALVIALGVLKALGKVSISDAYKNSPELFWILGALAAGWAILQFAGMYKKREVQNDEHFIKSEAEAKDNLENAKRELGIPERAVNCDIMIFRYKVKNGRCVPSTSGTIAAGPYTNVNTSVFREGDDLMIADYVSVCAFPIAEMKSIQTIDKGVILPYWNKAEEGPYEGRFKQYKIKPNQYGIGVKPYYILEIERDGERWGIWFPCYELPVIEELTGLKA